MYLYCQVNQNYTARTEMKRQKTHRQCYVHKKFDHVTQEQFLSNVYKGVNLDRVQKQFPDKTSW